MENVYNMRRWGEFMMCNATNDLLDRIRFADADTVSNLLPAMIQRYSEVFEDWEIMTVVMPRNDPDAQVRTLQSAIAFIERRRAEIMTGGEKGNDTSDARSAADSLPLSDDMA